MRPEGYTWEYVVLHWLKNDYEKRRERKEYDEGTKNDEGPENVEDAKNEEGAENVEDVKNEEDA